MKKVLFAVLIATSLFSCKKELVSTDSKSDTLNKVDSVKVDSVKTDTVK